MALSKSTRILILLGIDSVFFLLELVVGYAVHSLALVADSFHMLNDVLSLCVGLWAVKVANQKTSSKMYTYGWQRAETLGALINGVFLVALCLSIFLEAIQRFVEPQEVSHPKLVLIVGCFGLASNIVGLFLFHEHGHSHGHSHGPTDGLNAAEEGRGMDHTREAVSDESGNVADILPQNVVGSWPTTEARKKNRSTEISWQTGDNASARTGTTSRQHRSRSRRHSRSRSRGYSSLEEIYVHPASFRNEIIQASRLGDVDSGSGEDTEGEAERTVIDEDYNGAPTETSPLLKKDSASQKSRSRLRRLSESLHKSHRHAQPREPGSKGGHSHGDLNMRGVFLHVMGDALGNLGVIASALIIWLTDFWWRFYSDPLISLIITVIILGSAIPLCKAASRILLQAVPAGISIDDIKEDIMELPGIVSCHHLHVWQLSDTKLVASLHVQVEFDFKGEGSARYMELARAIRKCLHEYGIHSSTIQPEFCVDRNHDHIGRQGPQDDETSCGEEPAGSSTVSPKYSRNGSVASKDCPGACLLECGDECGDGKQCCAPNGVPDPAGDNSKPDNK